MREKREIRLFVGVVNPHKPSLGKIAHGRGKRPIISRQDRKLFEAWDTEAPVDDWERERARRIEQRQGNKNPFVQ